MGPLIRQSPRHAVIPVLLAFCAALAATVSCSNSDPGGGQGSRVRFAAAADMREFAGDNPDYFRGACEAIRAIGGIDFVISPGDLDPPDVVFDTLQTYLSPQIIWYPIVGNHEQETASDMAWLRAFNPGGWALPRIVKGGPPGTVETCYSFDYDQAHFVVLNEYYDGSSDIGALGDVGDALHAWLVEDLTATSKRFVFVLGHEPAYPLPDEDNGRLRHVGESLDKDPGHRDRFWATLAEHGVTAYICGHSHTQSNTLIDGVWQIDVGHARGLGDTLSRSTFVLINVDDQVVVKVYRLEFSTGRYVQTSEVVL